MATLVRTPEGFFQSGTSGLIPITDPVQLRDLNSGNTPYIDQTKAANVGSPSGASSTSGPQAPITPGASATTTTQSGGDPYTLFNMNLAAMLKQIQTGTTTGSANLGGARDALNTSSVTAAGGYDPSTTPTGNIANLTGTKAAFQPAVTSINTQLENAGSALGNLKGDISTMAGIFQPREVSPGSSLVGPGGAIIKQGHQYTPQMNPNTGQLDGFDITSGTWASNDQSTGSSNSIVGGIDFSGASTSTQPYATDPKYAAEVGGIYKAIASASPVPSIETVDAYIKGHAGSSPVTGTMIMNAATQYGVDPNLLTAVLAQESDFGTAGVGAKTNNPGNVGNTDNGGTTNYKSWQQGVNAAAYELQKRQVPGQKPQPQQQSAIGGDFSPEAAKKIAQIPGPMQSYVDAGPKGVAYINDDRVPANLKDSVKIMASRAGIPYVQAGDVNALKAIGVVYKSLEQMQSLADQNLSSGTLGHIKDTILGGIAQSAQTDWGNNLALFNSYRDTAIKAVQALAGGAGSGLKINGAEIAANVANLAGAGDSSEHATKLIGQMKTLIDNQLEATFPYIKSDSASSQTVRVKLSDGRTGTVISTEFDPATMTKI